MILLFTRINICKLKASLFNTVRQKNTVCYRSNIRQNGDCRWIALQKVYLHSGQRGRKIPYATGVTYGETANAVGLRYRKYIRTPDSEVVSPLIGEVATQEPEGLTDRLRKIPYVTEVTYGETANAVAEKEGFEPSNRF